MIHLVRPALAVLAIGALTACNVPTRTSDYVMMDGEQYNIYRVERLQGGDRVVSYFVYYREEKVHCDGSGADCLKWLLEKKPEIDAAWRRDSTGSSLPGAATPAAPAPGPGAPAGGTDA